MVNDYPMELFVSGLTSPEGPAFDQEGNLFRRLADQLDSQGDSGR